MMDVGIAVCQSLIGCLAVAGSIAGSVREEKILTLLFTAIALLNAVASVFFYFLCP